MAHGVRRAMRSTLIWQGLGTASAATGPAVSMIACCPSAWLALVGSIPSLEEWHLWESWPAATRTERWIDHLLADRRAPITCGATSAGIWGADDGTFLLFRRRRLSPG